MCKIQFFVHYQNIKQKPFEVNFVKNLRKSFQLTGDKDESGGQLFKDYDTLALVSSSEDNSDGSWGQSVPQGPLVLGEEVAGSSLGSPESQNLIRIKISTVVSFKC